MPLYTIPGFALETDDVYVGLWVLAMTSSQATWALAVLWPLVGVILGFLCLRIYTRVAYVSRYGADDYCFIITSILFVVSAAIMHIIVGIGYAAADAGTDLTSDDIKRVTLLLLAWQTVLLVATPLSKGAIGLFLLRLVQDQWQRILIWCCLGFCTLVSTTLIFLAWLECKPFDAGWDPRIEAVSCVNLVPITMLWGWSTITLDVVFAILPWIFIWKLSKPRREKIFIASTLSIGVVAGAAGVIRFWYLIRALITEPENQIYIATSVWTAVEISASLIATAIPASLPVYRGWYQRCAGCWRRRRPATMTSHQPLVDFTIGGRWIGTGPSAAASAKKPSETLLSSSQFTTTGTMAAGDEGPAVRYGGVAGPTGQVDPRSGQLPPPMVETGQWLSSSSNRIYPV